MDILCYHSSRQTYVLLGFFEAYAIGFAVCANIVFSVMLTGCGLNVKCSSEAQLLKHSSTVGGLVLEVVDLLAARTLVKKHWVGLHL